MVFALMIDLLLAVYLCLLLLQELLGCLRLGRRGPQRHQQL